VERVEERKDGRTGAENRERKTRMVPSKTSGGREGGRGIRTLLHLLEQQEGSQEGGDEEEGVHAQGPGEVEERHRPPLGQYARGGKEGLLGGREGGRERGRERKRKDEGRKRRRKKGRKRREERKERGKETQGGRQGGSEERREGSKEGEKV